METAALVASVVSVIIGAFAIWLAVTFYRMSSKSAEEIKSASTQIDSSVGRLETLFDKLYTDSFSLVKQTYTDMSKQVWRSPEDTKEEQEKIFGQYSAKLEQLISEQSGASRKMEDLREEIQKILSNAVEDTRQLESDTATRELNYRVMKSVVEHPDITVQEIARTTHLSMNLVVEALQSLRRQGLIVFDPKSLNPTVSMRPALLEKRENSDE